MNISLTSQDNVIKEEQQTSGAMTLDEILKLRNISARDQEVQTASPMTQTKETSRKLGRLSQFAVFLGSVIDCVTGPASTDQERYEATAMMASTRSKSGSLY